MKINRILFLLFYNIAVHSMTEIPTTVAKEQKTDFYDVIGKVIAPLKSGYDYSVEEKLQAHKKISQLVVEKAQAIAALSGMWVEVAKNDYILNSGNLSDEDIDKILSKIINLNSRMDEQKVIIKDLENQILKQKIITGEVMSAGRILFWGGVALGSAIIGGKTYKYFVKMYD